MSKKNLNYYLKLPYSIIIDNNNNDGIIEYFAYCNELGKFSCYGIGNTTEEALKNFYEEKDIYINYLFESGLPIPEPISTNKYSGIFNVRTSPIIHANLVNQAKENGISLNLYVNQILSGHVEKVKYEHRVEKSIIDLCRNLTEQSAEFYKQIKYNLNNLIPPNMTKNCDKNFRLYVNNVV